MVKKFPRPNQWVAFVKIINTFTEAANMPVDDVGAQLQKMDPRTRVKYLQVIEDVEEALQGLESAKFLLSNAVNHGRLNDVERSKETT